MDPALFHAPRGVACDADPTFESFTKGGNSFASGSPPETELEFEDSWPRLFTGEGVPEGVREIGPVGGKRERELLLLLEEEFPFDRP